MPIKVIASAPAKVILFGEHAVVFGHPAIATAINRTTTAEVTNNSTNVLRLIFEKLDLDLSINLPLSDVTASLTVQQDQAVKCAVLGFKSIADRRDPAEGITIKISSDFSLGAGLGSSASFSVVLVSALIVNSYLNSGDDPYDKNGKDLNSAVLAEIRKTAHECEKIMHGSPSGVDMETVMLGGIVRFKKNVGTAKIADSLPMKLAIVNSNVSRQTSKLTQGVRDLKSRLEKPVTNILSTIEEVTEQVLKEIKNPTSENTFLDLVRINHGLLVALGVSHPVLERIGLSVSNLAVGFKLTGAGGGGNAIIFIPRNVDPELVVSSLGVQGFVADIVDIGVPGLEVKVIEC